METKETMNDVEKQGGVSVDRHFKQVPDFEVREDGTLKTFEDPAANRDAYEQRVREQVIALEYLQIVGRRLKRCWIEQGVNRIQNCKELTDQYRELYRAQRFGTIRNALPEELR